MQYIVLFMFPREGIVLWLSANYRKQDVFTYMFQ